ncbi:AAA family ATPase [Patescibacteria group bacterium]|nr:AAA family ATPase [Patescibacteria group bacterium]MBU1890976.1 AAA family ATPase [Patescibacteria group bacterium]
MIIGITGYFGAGKGTVADYLKANDFIYHSCSNILREENKKLGQEETIENLIALGNRLREEHGPGVLAKRLLEKIKDNKEELSIVDSLRHPDEINVLKETGDFVLISVDAPIDIRYERTQLRKRDDDKMTFEEFRKQEQFQLAGEGSQAQLLNCVKMADYNLVNDGTIEDLQKKVDEIIDEIIAN